jgi:glycoprotein-N-acetylgalactosamine 3-beta-galactosyltransferase
MENLRHMLYQYRPETSLYFGHRYATEFSPYSYMAGGGYVLSKGALTKLSEKILTNSTACRQDNDGAEDYELGNILSFLTIFF